jgi:hypothetical protein
MLQDRLFGAFSFKDGIYYEVEHDESFTSTAWILVAVSAFLAQLGANASSDFVDWLIRSLALTIVEVIAFALAAFLIFWIGKNFFSAEVSYKELVRALGLAHVWRAVGVLGVVTAFLPGFACILLPVTILAILLGLAAWFVAAREALDLDLVQALVTVIIGFFGFLIIVQLFGAVLGFLGFAGSLY